MTTVMTSSSTLSVTCVVLCVMTLTLTYIEVTQASAGFDLAAYRVRRHYTLKDDPDSPTIDRLKELLDLADNMDLRVSLHQTSS